jgi:integrase
MAGLHWDRVNLDRGSLSVVETFDEKSGNIKAYPKGRKRRETPIPPWLVELLAERPRQKRCGLSHTAGRCRSGLVVITTEAGSVLRNSNWSPIWRDAVDRARVGEGDDQEPSDTCGSTTCATPTPAG